MPDPGINPGIDPAREATRELLQAALAAVGLAVALADLTDGLALDLDLGVDSYRLTEVARHIEEAHALRFTLVDWVVDAGDSEAGYTVGSLLDYVTAQLSVAAAPSPTPSPALAPKAAP